MKAQSKGLFHINDMRKDAQDMVNSPLCGGGNETMFVATKQKTWVTEDPQLQHTQGKGILKSSSNTQ